MPRFLCDAMLGSLARWLRFFGLDCGYCDVAMDDAAVAYRAEGEGRWLLSMDRELVSTGPPRAVLIRGSELDEQVVEVFRRFDLDPAPDLARARCAQCNGELLQVAREELREVVPPYVWSTADRFRRCARCGRVFWPGTHSVRIVRRMERISDRLHAARASAIMKRETQP